MLELPLGDSLPGGSGGDQAAASFYDNTGGQSISGSVDTVVNIDTTKQNNAPTVFSLATDIVTINEAADYFISFEVTADLGSGTRSGLMAKLQVDTGGGFVDVDGSLAYCYGRITSEVQGTASGSIILALATGDKIRLVAQGASQSFDTLADGSRLNFIQLKGPKGDAGPTGPAGDGSVEMQAIIFDFADDVTIGDGKFYIHIGEKIAGKNLTYVHAEVITAGTTGTTDIQIHNVTQVVDVLSTKLTIDSGETGSDTAAITAVINLANDNVLENDLLRIDVDSVSTTAPKGLIVTLGFGTP